MRWVGNLSKHVAALASAEFPEDGICHHLGVSVHHPGIQAGILIAPGDVASREVKAPGLMFMIYRSKYDQQGRHIGHSASTFKRWRNGVASLGRIVDEWNGKPGHEGISIITDIPTPKGFSRAIENYSKVPNVFEPTPEEAARFEAWALAWYEALRRQGIEVKK